MRVRALVIQAAAAGAEGGLLALGLILRLNPELRPPVGRVLVAAAMWAGWGAVGLGLPLAVVFAAAGRWTGRKRPPTVLATMAMAALLAVAAFLTRWNADLFRLLLTGTGHRLLGQDAVVLLLVAFLVAGVTRGAVARGNQRLCWLGIAMAVTVPWLRVLWRPTPAPQPLEVPLHVAPATRPLLVVGVEGLDLNFMLRWTGSGRYPALEQLIARGAWGDVRGYRPYLRRSLWTSVATGCYPRRHGVKMRQTVVIPELGPQPVGLVPWTPLGSRWFLPPWVEPGPPPVPRRPPLWAWLGRPGGSEAILGWPGAADRPRSPGSAPLPTGLRPALAEALGRLPEDHRDLIGAVAADAGRVKAAIVLAGDEVSSIWVRLGALAQFRERFEAGERTTPEERVALELGVEALDEFLGELLAAWNGRGPMAVVSPVGRRRPGGLARAWDFLRQGGEGRVTARGVPPGLAIIVARGAVPGRRFAPCQVVDVAPTLAYLLDVPLPTWVEGRVLLPAIEPRYLAQHPLRVAE